MPQKTQIGNVVFLGASRPTPPTQNTPLAVRALLERLDDLHSKHCHCIGIAYRCRPLERRLMAALKALEHGSSVDDAVAVAGSFGVLGSVEVAQ